MAARVEQIWFKDPVSFLTDMDSLLNFIPDGKTSLEEQLNAAFRFSVYFGVLVGLIRHDFRVLFFPVFVAVFTIFVYHYEEQHKKTKNALYEKLGMMPQDKRRGNSACMLPTRHNPYMNVLISDYTDFPNRPGACAVNNRVVKQKINAYANGNVPRNAGDVHKKQSGDLYYYTMPSTSIPNDQTGFAHWLYNPGKSRKETGVLHLD